MILALTIYLMGFIGNGEIVVKDQWLRPAAEKMTTALYFTIENNGTTPDTLYSVSTDVCKMVQIHETYSSNDMMGMREIGEIVVDPGSTVDLKPGGMHIMVMKLKSDINVDDEVEFVLKFRQAGDILIKAKAIN